MNQRPNRHLRDDELEWFDYDPSELVALVQEQVDYVPGLAERLVQCRRAAWRCETGLVFAVGRSIDTSLSITSGAGEEILVDLTRDGHPISLEYASRNCDLP